MSPEDMVITSGCAEGVTLALHATCRPGDTVAIESPASCTFLQVLQWLGLKVLEIPSTPREGMSLDVLDYAIRNGPVRACFVVCNFSNPVGSLMPDEKKRDLVALLAKHEIPLIEDDVHGDLAFDVGRPTTAKAYDRNGLVLLCSSFSKTLAPGYRVGWIVPGRFQREVERLKGLLNVATTSATQIAIGEFLASGGYDRHLRTIRRIYARQMNEVRVAIARHLPAGTRTTRPAGGFVLWVEMPEAIDSFELYEAALQQGIAVAPGHIFATNDRFKNFMRVNAGYWSERIDRALQTVGSLAQAQL
jgi:DNA-binding transcriptional MocR family regulator